ncbi:MAG: transposase, partial [Phycisphaerae bacterium]
MVQRIEISLDGLRQLRHRIDGQQLEAGDWPVVGALVSKLIARTEAQQRRMLNKLAADVAHEGEAGPTQQNEESSGDGASLSDTSTTNSAHTAESSDRIPMNPVSGDDDSTKKPEPEKKSKGHGRNGANAFVNAKHFFHTLALSIVGALCDACGPGRGSGRMSRYREKVIVRIVGQPLFGAEVHHYEQVRCRICGRIIRATGPDEVLDGFGTSYITYDWSACAMLIVIHYFAGGPFKRLESLHNGWGVPMPDSNQWSMVDACADLLSPLYKAIERHAIQNAINLRIDDTGSMVISLRKQIHAEIAALESIGESTNDVRTGINATGVYLETQNGVVILFYTGRHHAGEMIDQLLKHRQSSKPKLVKVTDGASKNFAHGQEDKLIEATCNAHAFLKFRGIKDKYPVEYAIAGEVYKQVFDNDDQAKARGLAPTERMLYHREHSKPLMEKLKAMCEDKIKSKLVEPRSLLWEPLTFIINQWPRLTKFYEEPGVPLDTNLIEQALIIPVRYLAGSFNYKNQTGAEVGDRHMSLVATARANDVEPVAYLTDCLRNHEDLAQRPEHYLPWVYRERIKERDKLSEPQPRANAPPTSR